jgi:hypothetical protein
MASWSKQRKLIYGGSTIIIIAGAIIIPAFLHFYKAPTCFDGAKNGNEQGTDYGAAWVRYEEVAPHLYNVAAYIVNPNTEGEASHVPYHIILYDKDGVIITDRSGTVTLPPGRNTLAFQGAINVGKRIPAKALFEFTEAPNWHKRIDPLSMISIGDKNYTEDSYGSALSVTLNNKDILPITNLSVYVVLYDKDGNALGFSKTVLDEIPANGSAIAPFTWPLDRKGAVISKDVLPVQE